MEHEKAQHMLASRPSGADTLADVTRFFVHEADLLDNWRLDAWLELLTPDARYVVPPLGSPDASARQAVFLIADDADNIRSRVNQLKGRSVWAENPRSRTRRIISNVIVREDDGQEVRATANFAVWRFQFGDVDTYVGHYAYTLVRAPSGLLLRDRRVILDMEVLRPHGKISFIL